MLGSAYGTIAHRLLPHVAAAAGAYGLVGMGAVFAAAARAPITAVLIVFELTGDYNVILPLMFAVVVATALSNRLSRDTIYTLKASPARHRRGRAPLTEPDGPDRGAVTRQPAPTAATLAREAPTLRPDDPLEDAVLVLGATDDEGVPVVGDHGERVVGWITHRRLLRAYRRRLHTANS